ncbi:hypothetical protein KXD40_001100 [Peronospora effusa]|nr:hypothetical protein KXD40_001100 [Peronospora effusa]
MFQAFGSHNNLLSYLYLHEGESDSKLLDILQINFGDALIAKMIHNSASVDDRLKNLQEAQFENWRVGIAGVPHDMAGYDV